MRNQPALTIALLGSLLAALTPAIAADSGGVVLGRRTGPDGALLIAPFDGARIQNRHIVITPGIPRADGRYGRSLPGYLGNGYGMVYEIPIQDRLYCPESRAYYPTVQACATPWLRLRPGGGVTADSPIPSPTGQYDGR